MFLAIRRITYHNHGILQILKEAFQYCRHCCRYSPVNRMWRSLLWLNIKCVCARELWIIQEHGVKIYMIPYPVLVHKQIAEFFYFLNIIGEWPVGIHIAR